MVDSMIRDLEQLKKWAVQYGKSEKYHRERIAAWTGKAPQ